LFAARISHGYALEGQRWTQNRTVMMNLSLSRVGILQDGFQTFNDSAADALAIWNNYLAHMKFAWIIASPLTPADGDGDNSVFFANNVYGDPFGGRTLAITLSSFTGTTFKEGDVIVNNHEQWSSYRGGLQSAYDLHRVLLHEFGHVLGLDHPDEAGQHVTALMNSVTSDLDSLAPDDIQGAQSIYNNGPP
jgi:hypothetical protein